MYRDDFASLSQWQLYDSAGHGGNGLRRPSQVSVANGVCTISGTASGTTGGMALRNHNQMFGKWTWRMRAAPGARVYNPVCLLWGQGSGSSVNASTGEIDVVECWQDAARQSNQFTLHYGDGTSMIGASTFVDMSQWRTYSLLWTPTQISTWIDDQRPYFITSEADKFPKVPMTVTAQLDWFPEEGTWGEANLQLDYVQIWTLAEATAAPPPTTSPPPPVTTQTYLFTFADHHRLWAGSTMGDTGPASGLPLVGRYVELSGTLDSTKATMNRVFGTGAWLAQYASPNTTITGSKTKLDISSGL